MNVKDILLNTVSKTVKDIHKYSEQPGKDFTRARKLPAETLIHFMLDMEGNSLNAEIYNNFPDKDERMTSSAFVQQRDKLKSDFFKELLFRFNDTLDNPVTMNGYRVFAVDGSDFCTPTNPESKYYIHNSQIKKDGTQAKGTCLVHANIMYDLLNRQYMNCIIDRDERSAAIELMHHLDLQDENKPIIIFDRGYNSFNMIEHGNRYGGYYIIRVPISGGIKEIASLPNQEVDKEISVRVSTKSQQFCDLYGYRKLNVTRDGKSYSAKTNHTRWDFEEICTVTFRVCKFKINEDGRDTWEVLVTNLNRFEFPLKRMKEMYHLRWGIETSFRELKYALGTINFHSKKDKYILQELYAHLVMYNATARIAAAIPIIKDGRKHSYAVDFKMVVHIFRIHFRKHNKAPPEAMIADMERYRQPIRPGRSDTRRLKPKSAVYFLYRVA